MASLAEQIKAIKLKINSEPMKDFSSPKLGGFMKKEDIEEYQNSVLDVNLETWFHLLKDFTFPSIDVAISIDEAKLFVKIYELNFANKSPETIANIHWQDCLSLEELEIINSLSEKLQEKINAFIEKDGGYVFVKLSSRSPKDAPLAQSKFKLLFKQHLQNAGLEEYQNENTQIICLLKASFDSLRMSSSKEVIDTCLRSERIYQDMLLALAVPERFRENFIVRKFVDIEVDMEFRGFVYNHKLTALSQYNYLIFSDRLKVNRHFYEKIICDFYQHSVAPNLEHFSSNFIIDFAVCDNGCKIWVIEINPFLITTDAGLFSWEHERHLLEGAEDNTIFRITEKPRPGAKAMLPFGMKQLINDIVVSEKLLTTK